MNDADRHRGRPRWLVPLVLAVAGTGLLAGVWLARQSAPEPAGQGAPGSLRAVLWPEARPLTPFRLATQHGESFGIDELSGRWSFLFFGYLQCPDVCPTTLAALRRFRELLIERDPADRQQQFVFVSVDPAYDTPEAMRDYLAFFDPDFVGLSGSADEVAVLASQLAVMYVEQREASGARSIDHTSSVMVVDPQGRVVAALPAPHDPPAMLQRFEQLRHYLGR